MTAERRRCVPPAVPARVGLPRGPSATAATFAWKIQAPGKFLGTIGHQIFHKTRMFHDLLGR